MRNNHRLEIRLLKNLHKTYTSELDKNHSEETKLKITNLLEMIDAVVGSLKKRSGNEKK